MIFTPFPKVPRLTREVVVTEKIDGTNAAVVVEGDALYAQSRKRVITPADDNFGFAAWVAENAAELLRLGDGVHFGEWWGRGIQRGYGLPERRFSLFNTARWSADAVRPACCSVVPVLWTGAFNTNDINCVLSALFGLGSVAAPGFMQPEGIMIYHSAANQLFKKTGLGVDGNKEVA